MALELVECTHCHYKFKTDVKAQLEDGEIPIVRGIFDFLKQKPRLIKTIDLDCPNCKKKFEHRVES